MSRVGELREGALHAALKRRLARPGDRLEVPVEGYVIDLVRASGELVEVQTGSFSPLRAKLDALLDRHRVRIVFPVPSERRIVRVDGDGLVISHRRSPLRPGASAVFDGLVSFPTLLSHPHFCVEVLLCREDHVRALEPRRGRRFRRDPGERRLVEVLSRVELACPDDLRGLLPPVPAAFTTRDLASLMGVALPLAQRTMACLRALELVERVGARGRAPLYSLKPASGLA